MCSCNLKQNHLQLRQFPTNRAPQWHSNIRPYDCPFYQELDQQSISHIGLLKSGIAKKSDMGKRMGHRWIWLSACFISLISIFLFMHWLWSNLWACSFFRNECKIQKNWCTVTVAPTIERHGGHSRTPANQRWDQVPGRSQRLLLG